MIENIFLALFISASGLALILVQMWAFGVIDACVGGEGEE